MFKILSDKIKTVKTEVLGVRKTAILFLILILFTGTVLTPWDGKLVHAQSPSETILFDSKSISHQNLWVETLGADPLNGSEQIIIKLIPTSNPNFPSKIEVLLSSSDNALKLGYSGMFMLALPEKINGDYLSVDYENIATNGIEDVLDLPVDLSFRVTNSKEAEIARAVFGVIPFVDEIENLSNWNAAIKCINEYSSPLTGTGFSNENNYDSIVSVWNYAETYTHPDIPYPLKTLSVSIPIGVSQSEFIDGITDTGLSFVFYLSKNDLHWVAKDIGGQTLLPVNYSPGSLSGSNTPLFDMLNDIYPGTPPELKGNTAYFGAGYSGIRVTLTDPSSDALALGANSALQIYFYRNEQDIAFGDGSISVALPKDLDVINSESEINGVDANGGEYRLWINPDRECGVAPELFWESVKTWALLAADKFVFENIGIIVNAGLVPLKIASVITTDDTSLIANGTRIEDSNNYDLYEFPWNLEYINQHIVSVNLTIPLRQTQSQAAQIIGGKSISTLLSATVKNETINCDDLPISCRKPIYVVFDGIREAGQPEVSWISPNPSTSFRQGQLVPIEALATDNAFVDRVIFEYLDETTNPITRIPIEIDYDGGMVGKYIGIQLGLMLVHTC